MASEIAALTEFLKQQMEASAQREKRRDGRNPRSDPESCRCCSTARAGHHRSSKPAAGSTVGQDCRCGPPNASSFCQSRRLHTWEEAWHDFSCCQKLSCQDKQTRASKIRQCLDEDLRRFLREDTISVPADPDASDIIDAVRTFICRQRNPLLNRTSFYNRQQHRGKLRNGCKQTGHFQSLCPKTRAPKNEQLGAGKVKQL